MRTLHKSWQDRRPNWTRRVRRFNPQYESEGIRLEFTDEHGKQNRTFRGSTAEADAALMWDAFVDGTCSTLNLPTRIYREEQS